MKGQIISHIELDGNMQMSIDTFLLKQSFLESNFEISARFYSWKGNWISIGRNQKTIPDKWHVLAKKKRIEIVRRPTGGNAVLHSGGITYSLIWKHPPKRKKEAYIQASQWLINGFSKLGITLKFGSQKSNTSLANCFARSTAADLIDSNGAKRVGSAQLWQKGHLLQHGEILLHPPEKLWVEIFEVNPPKIIPIQLSHRQIESILSKELISNWSGLKWNETSINEKFLSTLSY